MGGFALKNVQVFFSLLTLTSPLLAHDMFLVVSDHDFAPGDPIDISLYNGTFDKSENTIDRNRMSDVTVVDGVGTVSHPRPDQWRDSGDVSVLTIEPGAPGTQVVGVSTKARIIELQATDFNEYLEHDGVLDVLEMRRNDGILDSAARELYSKHVKTILQVGAEPTDSWSHRFGYPVEIVPSTSPSRICVGDELQFEVLANGDPAADQLFYASYDGHHGHDDDGAHREAISGLTDAAGVGRFEIPAEGRWYVRLIRMVESKEEGVDYESNWATLTFEIGCNGDD